VADSRGDGQDGGVNDSQTLPRLARGMWTLLEPIHGVTYFAPEGRASFEAAGLRGFWRGYFAGRTAPLGPVQAATVTALFFSFSPALTTRALPAVWSLIDPAATLTARAEGAAAALRRTTPTSVTSHDVARLAEALWQLVERLDGSGRALGAVNAALPRPDDPYQALWQAATTFREHRGDGHVAALVAADLTGLEALVLRAAGDLHRAVLQPARGWSDDEWDAAAQRLAQRGLIGGSAPEPSLTDSGWRTLSEVEEITDRIAGRAWADLAEAGELHPLAAQLREITQPCLAGYPQFDPIGLRVVWDPIAEPAGAGWSGARAQVG
jgi:hypothetical protein